MSLTEGTELLFKSEWVLYPAFGSPPVPTTHPYSTPIDSIRDITGTEKTILIINSIQIARRISYEMNAKYLA